MGGYDDTLERLRDGAASHEERTKDVLFKIKRNRDTLTPKELDVVLRDPSEIDRELSELANPDSYKTYFPDTGLLREVKEFNLNSVLRLSVFTRAFINFYQQFLADPEKVELNELLIFQKESTLWEQFKTQMIQGALARLTEMRSAGDVPGFPEPWVGAEESWIKMVFDRIDLFFKSRKEYDGYFGKKSFLCAGIDDAKREIGRYLDLVRGILDSKKEAGILSGLKALDDLEKSVEEIDLKKLASSHAKSIAHLIRSGDTPQDRLLLSLLGIEIPKDENTPEINIGVTDVQDATITGLRKV